MSDRPTISPDDSGKAAEYVLGLLPDAEAREMRQRLASEPALRAEVHVWERRFATMAEQEVAPVTPPASVEAQLVAHLFREDARPWWQWAGLWRGAAALAMAGLVAVAVLVYTGGPGSRAEPEFTAILAAEDGALVLAAALDLDSGQLSVTRQSGAVAEGRAQELWLIAGDAAPVSLGLLSAQAETRVAVPEPLRALFAGGVLAVSDEPPGGSPTGAPTGEVLAVGAVSEI